MKRTHTLYLALLLGTSLTLGSCHSSRSTSQKSIVILSENDVHCNIDGYAKLAGLRDAISDTAHCLVVSSGDFLQGGTAGAISQGEYIADIMEEVNYTAIAPGNHEFDFGMKRMFDLLDEIDAPITCVNLRRTKDKQLEYAPYIMARAGSKKVAFVGVLTPTTLYSESAAFYDGDGRQTHELDEKNLYPVVQKAIDQARKEGADYVILLSHVGEDDNKCHVQSHDMIAALNGVDAVFDGHTHSVVPGLTLKDREQRDVLISQTGTQFQHIGKLVIQPNGQQHFELIPLSKVTQSNAAVQAVTDSIKRLYNQLVSQPIATSDVPLAILDSNGKRIVRSQECTAGNIVSDAYRYVSGADISITNGGGIRSQLQAGRITYGDVLSLLPYENYVCVVEASGKEIKDLLEVCTEMVPAESGDFPQLSGLKVTIDPNVTPRLTQVLVQDKQTGTYQPIEDEKKYSLATIDYCITGGGLQKKLQHNKVLKQNIMLYYEALVEYCKKGLNGHIDARYAAPEGRITILPLR